MSLDSSICLGGIFDVAILRKMIKSQQLLSKQKFGNIDSDCLFTYKIKNTLIFVTAQCIPLSWRYV
jgi:hypothetical protein